MKRSQAFPTKYLSKDDIHAPTVGVIETVVNETLGQGEDQEVKPVCYFSSGLTKPMVLNATNWMSIEALYGDESDSWGGKSIEVWVDPTVSFGNKRIGGLRLRAPATNGNGHSAPPRDPAPGTLGGGTLTKEQAIAAVVAAGLTKDDLAAILPERDGKRTYSPERDTEAVYNLIAKNTPPEQPF